MISSLTSDTVVRIGVIVGLLIDVVGAIIVVAGELPSLNRAMEFGKLRAIRYSKRKLIEEGRINSGEYGFDVLLATIIGFINVSIDISAIDGVDLIQESTDTNQHLRKSPNVQYLRLYSTEMIGQATMNSTVFEADYDRIMDRLEDKESQIILRRGVVLLVVGFLIQTIFNIFSLF